MYLIVTVDTEEEGLWGGSYPADGGTVRNVIEGVPRFQEVCERYGVRPVYLIDTPVATDPTARGLLRELAAAGRCEVAAHLHPWCTEPHGTYTFPRDSYMMNLPPELQARKLQTLTEQITEAVGRRPTSFRAGRYGLDATGAALLIELGYHVDSSIVPFTRHTRDGGPDFSEASPTPFWFDGTNWPAPGNNGTAAAPELAPAAQRPPAIEAADPQGRAGGEAKAGKSPAATAARTLLEVPVAAGYTRTPFDWRHRLRDRLERSWVRRIKAVGVIDRLGIARRVKFCPEQAEAADLKALIDCYLDLQMPCMVMMMHSSSLAAGYSPYTPTLDALERFYARLEETLDHARRRGLQPVTFEEFYQAYLRSGA